MLPIAGNEHRPEKFNLEQKEMKRIRKAVKPIKHEKRFKEGTRYDGIYTLERNLRK